MCKNGKLCVVFICIYEGLWVPQPLSVRPSCGLLSLTQEDLPHKVQVLSSARHPSVGTLGGNSCEMAAVSLAFAFFFLCFVCMWTFVTCLSYM